MRPEITAEYTAEVQARIERRRGRPLTLAERNIEIVQLDRDLAAGKERLRAAVARAQTRAVRQWIRHGMRGHIHIRVTPELERAVADLFEAGRQHGERELRRGGYEPGREFMAPSPDETRMRRLLTKLSAMLGGLSGRLVRTATTMDLSELTQRQVAERLAQIPGAKDVASRMVSGSLYAGLGSAFDRAAEGVDATPLAGGGNGWEYTAVMDDGTCDPCAEKDGTTYDTWDEAQADLPDGGPNPDCDGTDRCRCRLAPVPIA